MQLEPHLNQVAEQVSAAAALGDDRTREIAANLATAVAPAVRLALLNTLSEAAEEITAELGNLPGAPAVSVRLDGTEVTIDVRPTNDQAIDDTARETRRDDGDANARISLRLSETLKADIDAAAARDGVSVNTWLVRAASAALEPNPLAAFGSLAKSWAGAQRPTGDAGRRQGPGSHGNSQRISGWING